jgi:zinc protease
MTVLPIEARTSTVSQKADPCQDSPKPHQQTRVADREFLSKLGIEYVATKELAGTSQKLTEYRLKNGLTVLLSERHVTPIATVMVVYHVGSRNEAVGYTGSTHFLEHMMFKGTLRHDPKKGTGLDDVLKPIGGYNNATTSYDRTNYFEIVPSHSIDVCLDLESDRMRHLLLRQEDHDSEMTVVRNELERGEDEPAELLQKHIFSSSFEEHPYHHPVIGWRSDVENAPIKRLRQFYDEFYWPNNATLVVIGDFHPEPVLKSIAHYFGPIPRSPKPFPTVYTKEPPQQGDRRFVIQHGGELPRVALAFHAVRAKDKDDYALDVLEGILGDENKKSSRLYKALVDSGLASEADANNTSLHDPGLFYFAATVNPPAKPAQLEKALLDVINDMKTKGVTPSELDRAKQSVIKRVKLTDSDPVGLAEQLAEAVAVADWQWLADYPKHITEVTAADVQRVAAKYLTDRNMTIGYYLPASAPPSKDTEAAGKTSAGTTPGAAAATDEKAKDDAPPPTVLQASEQKQKSEGQSDITAPATPPVAPMPNQAPGSPEPAAKGQAGTQSGKISTAPLSPTKQGTGKFARQVHRFVLKNGLTLLVMPIKGTGTVAVSAHIKAGEYFRDPNKTTVPDLVADMMTEGSQNFSKEEFAEKLESLGSTLQFTNDDFWLGFSSEVISEDLAKFMPLVSDALQHPLYKDDELAKAKKVKQAAIKDQMSDCQNVSYNRFVQSWYKPSCVYYSKPFEQQLAELETVTTDDLKRFHQAHVTPANTVLAIVGDIDTDGALAQVQSSLGQWSGGPPEQVSIDKSLIRAQPESKIIMAELPDKSNVDVVIGHPVSVSVTKADYLPCLLANAAFGYDSFACRLAPVRDQYGLSYNIYSTLTGEFPYAPWMIAYSVNPSNYSRALALVKQIGRDYIKTGITPLELRKEKPHLEGAFFVSLRAPKQIATKLSELEILGLGPEFMDDYGPRLRQVSVAQVNECIRKYFNVDASVISACGTLHKDQQAQK